MKKRIKSFELSTGKFKIDLKMKLFFLLLVVTTFALRADPSYAQVTKISMHVKNGTIAQVFKKIESTTEFKFIFRTKDVNLKRKVSVNAEKEDISNLLRKLFSDQKLTFEIRDRKILIHKTKPEAAVQSSRKSAQQQFTVSGTVVDDKGVPLLGVNVVEKGTSNGASTDFVGKFSLAVSNKNATLVISYVGFKTKEVPIKGQNTLNVNLKPNAAALDEVVVVGYGTQRKQDVTGALSSIKAEDIVTEGSSNVEKSLQGKVAGVQVESAGGNPGSGVRVLIRGTGSLGNNNPLYIVDGVQVDNINNIAPSDIKSLDILKDASAAAIYGSRAANGVVLVTTKTGENGENHIKVSAYYGVQKITDKLGVLNASEWSKVSNEAHDNAGLDRLQIAQNPESKGKGTNWQDAIYRIAPTQNYHLSASGGGGTIRIALQVDI